jgi:hypothetical protein
MDFSGLNQTNEALTRFGQTIYQIGMDKKRTDDERNNALGLLEFHTWATDQTNITLNKLHKASYTDLWTDEGNQGDKVLTDLSKSFQDRYETLQSKNPTSALNMRKVSDGLVSEAKQKYAGAFEKKKIDHFLGVYQTFEDQQYKKTVGTFDPVNRAQEVSKFDYGLLDLVKGGVMDEKTAGTERIKFRNKVDKDSAKMLVDSLVPGSTVTPDQIKAQLNDPNLFPYLSTPDRAGMVHTLATQAKTWDADVKKENQEKAMANIYDGMDIVRKMMDSGQRAQGIATLEGLINVYSADRTIDSEKRKLIVSELKDLREGKNVISDPQAELELTILVATGKIGINGMAGYPGVSPQDINGLIKYKHSLDSQMDAIGRSAANQQRSFDIAEQNRNREAAINRGIHIITKKDAFSMMDSDQAYWAAKFTKDVIDTSAKGGDPWSVVDRATDYSSKMEVPFINVPGSKWGAGRPTSMEQVQTLKTWIPYYISQGKTKEANILAEQLGKAQHILEAREINATRTKPTTEQRRTR